MELILVLSHGNSWEIKAVFGTLVTAASEARKNKTRQVHVIYTAQIKATHFYGVLNFCLLT